MKIFTLKYFPFTMGGKVWRPVCCEVEADGPYDIGKGFKAYVVTAPNGKAFVVDAESGGLIGPNLKTVKEDVRNGKKSFMIKQVAEAVETSKEATEISADEFWTSLKCNKKSEDSKCQP